MRDYVTESRPWWQRGAIYQVYPRSFKDSRGDGIGDFPGILSKLDYLAWLGVEAVWISPFYPSPMVDFGYDVADYFDVDPIFGTLEDFDELLRRAHDLGLRVILDFVPNHTSNQHPWFIESRSSRASAKHDWYIWRDARRSGGRPNNWLSIFGGPAWALDEQLSRYYMHSFLPEQPDLNWRNPEVREAMLEVLRFWLDRGVDGFRIDAIVALMKDVQFRDDPPNPNYVSGVGHPRDSLLHRYSQNRPDVHGILRDFRGVLDEYHDKMNIGEISYGLSLDDLVTFYGNGGELDIPMNFKLISLPWEPVAIREFVDRYEQALPSLAWPNYVLGNHDRSRVASRIGSGQARVAALLLLTLRGTPIIYYGEELGMLDADIPTHMLQDPYGFRVPGQGRDPERSPMQWNAEAHAGFSEFEPWLPVGANYQIANVASQRKESTSMLNLYRQLLKYRKEAPALNLGSYRSLDGAPEDCFVYIREIESQRLAIALNFSAKGRVLRMDDQASGRLILSTHLDREERVDLRSLHLRGNEACIVEL